MRRVLLFCLAIVVGALSLGFVAWIRFDPQRKLDVYRRRALFQTDHREVLAECQDLMKHAKNAPGKSIQIYRGSQSFPPTIAALKPSWVVASPDHVEIELGGGFAHYGLRTGSATPQRPTGEVEKQLIPELYYYDENGRVPGP